MRKYFLIFCLFFTVICSYSQDLIIRNNGDRIECKIIKEDSSNVYFIYNSGVRTTQTFLPKSQVKELNHNMQSETDTIFYIKESGRYRYYQRGSKLNSIELSSILNSNSVALSEFQEAKGCDIVASALIFSGSLIVAIPIALKYISGDFYEKIAIFGGSLVIVAIPISMISKSIQIRSIKILCTGNILDKELI